MLIILKYKIKHTFSKTKNALIKKRHFAKFSNKKEVPSEETNLIIIQIKRAVNALLFYSTILYGLSYNPVPIACVVSLKTTTGFKLNSLLASRLSNLPDVFIVHI